MYASGSKSSFVDERLWSSRAPKQNSAPVFFDIMLKNLVSVGTVKVSLQNISIPCPRCRFSNSSLKIRIASGQFGKPKSSCCARKYI